MPAGRVLAAKAFRKTSESVTVIHTPVAPGGLDLEVGQFEHWS